MKKLSLVGVLMIVMMTFWMGRALGQKDEAARPTAAEASPEEIYQALLRTEESGKVKVEIVYLSPRFFEILKAGNDKGQLQQFETIQKYQEEGRKHIFTVSLNTHEVNLPSYQIEKISFLRDDRGQEYPAAGWDEGQSGMPSHHRMGILVFPKVDAQGSPIISDKAKFVELVIKDLAGVKERTFRWSLPLN